MTTLSLFFDCSAGHRALPSFPTRRSSDLPRGRLGVDDLHQAQLFKVEKGAGGRQQHDEHGDAEQDRKSTRLNSSHGYISYAVFCLKKKNIHPPGWPGALLRWTTVRPETRE